MYYISEIQIDGFWHKGIAQCRFFRDLSMIIGKNGSGKTTFINILTYILDVDFHSLNTLDFKKVLIKLSNGKVYKNIEVVKTFHENNGNPTILYKVSKKTYEFNQISNFNKNVLNRFYDSLKKQRDELKNELDSLIKVQSLSVFRLRNRDDYELIEMRSEILSPVDYKLSEVMSRFTSYQLELSQKANTISDELRKEALFSILYDSHSHSENMTITFNREEEKTKLKKAFEQVNAYDSKVEKKINQHLDLLEKDLMRFKEIKDAPFSEENFRIRMDSLPSVISSIQSLKKTNAFVNLSLEAEEKKNLIFEPLNVFIEILKEFLDDKIISINQDGLMIKNKYRERIDITSLSSGEKQVIILLTETLLQRNQQNTYITDEPELSLHISWQRKIIPSIIKLNPNAQIIVATHSPEIASYDKSKIISMREIFNG